MKDIRIVTLLFIFCFLSVLSLSAQDNNNVDKWYNGMLDFKSLQGEHKIIGGMNLGATTPLPIPNRFTKFSWEPVFTPYLGWEFSLYGEKKIGFTSGVIFSKKGMKAAANVYQVYTSVIIDDAIVEGYFTGRSETLIDNIYITLPMLFTYNNYYYKVDFGVSFNYLLMGKFNGTVKDGYIRIGDPTGPRTDIVASTYEFNDEIKKFEMTFNMGFERKIIRNLHLAAGLSLSAGSMMKPDFKGLEGKFKNIYGNVGIVYYFNKYKPEYIK